MPSSPTRCFLTSTNEKYLPCSLQRSRSTRTAVLLYVLVDGLNHTNVSLKSKGEPVRLSKSRRSEHIHVRCGGQGSIYTTIAMARELDVCILLILQEGVARRDMAAFFCLSAAFPLSS